MDGLQIETPADLTPKSIADIFSMLADPEQTAAYAQQIARQASAMAAEAEKLRKATANYETKRAEMQRQGEDLASKIAIEKGTAARNKEERDRMDADYIQRDGEMKTREERLNAGDRFQIERGADLDARSRAADERDAKLNARDESLDAREDAVSIREQKMARMAQMAKDLSGQ